MTDSDDEEDDEEDEGKHLFFDVEKDKHAKGTQVLTAMWEALDNPESKLASMVRENKELASLLATCLDKTGLS